MRLSPLYRVEFPYPEHYEIDGPDVGGIFLAEGRCEGALTGRFRGLNHPRLRFDDVYLPNFQGVIETEDGFEVALVRHTLEATTLGSLKPGDSVNLEVDVLAKYVERLAAR